MEDLEFSVKALAAVKNLTIDELAKLSGINMYHLREVSSGRAKMTGDDVLKLSRFTGVPAEQIKVS